MTLAVKDKQPVVIPKAALRRAGFKNGQELEINASGGVINIVPKLPTADEEYTPAERRIIDSRLTEARRGPYHGPFETADAAITVLRKEIKRRKAARRKTP